MIKTARIEIHPKMDMDVNWGTNKLCIMGVIKNYSKGSVRVTFDISFKTPAFDYENEFGVSINLGPSEREKYRSGRIEVPQFCKELFTSNGAQFELSKPYNVNVAFLD